MKKFLLLVLIIASGCQSVMKTVYGIKDPKVENKESIHKYLEKKELRTDNVYTYDFQSYIHQLKKGNNSIPEVYIFNSKGEYIPYGDEYACNAAAFSFIEELDRTKQYEISDKFKLESELKGLLDSDGNMVSVEPSENVDYYILLHWVVYAGKLNKDHVKVWEDQAMNNSKAKIKLLKVNMDFQESWGPENLALIGFE